MIFISRSWGMNTGRALFKDAVDSLLDAYRNLQWMNHTLQIGNNSTGLDESLGLVLPSKAWGGFLAAYVNKKGGLYDTPTDAGTVQAPTIIMPGKSTSFAHEWGHALDYHILDKMGADWGSGMTGRIRTNSKTGEQVRMDNALADLKEAMGDLLNVMFFDKASLAAKIM